METKVNSNKEQIHHLHTSNYIYISPEGSSDGLWLLLTEKDTFQLLIMQASNIYIHCKIQDKLIFHG